MIWSVWSDCLSLDFCFLVQMWRSDNLLTIYVRLDINSWGCSFIHISFINIFCLFSFCSCFHPSLFKSNFSHHTKFRMYMEGEKFVNNRLPLILSDENKASSISIRFFRRTVRRLILCFQSNSTNRIFWTGLDFNE